MHNYLGRNENTLTITYVFAMLPHIDEYRCEVLEMNTLELSVICKALSDPNRLQIVQMLSNGERCGCKLLEAFDITQPTLSHHMKILCECGLVNARKGGKWQHYSLNMEVWKQFVYFIGSMVEGEQG